MPDPFGCDYCASDGNRLHGHIPEVASRNGRERVLIQCPKCESLYEQTESRSIDRRVTAAEARMLYLWDPL